MLNAYLAQLQALIQAPNSPTPLVPAATQTLYINSARSQLAGDAECIRPPNAQLALTVGTWVYGFGSIVVPGSFGYGPVITVRSALLAGGGGGPIDLRPFEWYQAYYQSSAATGAPALAAQHGQGVSGTLYFSPVPNGSFTVLLDCVCLPIPLVDDATVEAIPDLWRDAVPFYAAWLAMQSLQRQSDAQAMLARYMMLAQRGRQMATPTELPDNLPGGVGARVAAARTTLGQPPTPQAR